MSLERTVNTSDLRIRDTSGVRESSVHYFATTLTQGTVPTIPVAEHATEEGTVYEVLEGGRTVAHGAALGNLPQVPITRGESDTPTDQLERLNVEKYVPGLQQRIQERAERLGRGASTQYAGGQHE